MEYDVSYIITFLLLCTALMVAIIGIMLSNMYDTIKTIRSLVEIEDEPDTACTNLPIGFEKVTGLNFTYCRRYKYVRNFLTDEFFVYDTKTGQLVKVNSNQKLVNTLMKHFEDDKNLDL